MSSSVTTIIIIFICS